MAHPKVSGEDFINQPVKFISKPSKLRRALRFFQQALYKLFY